MRELTDADLVQRSTEGDQAAFAELMRRHQGPLAALVRRLVSDADQAEDLLQETLIQGWLKIGTVRSPDRVRAWLLQVARNCCRDYHKSAGRREQPAEQCELEWHLNRYGRSAPPEQSAYDMEDALRLLAPTEREAVDLFYLQGLTIKEICSATSSPIGTVKSRLFSARHHLRSYYSADEEKGHHHEQI